MTRRLRERTEEAQLLYRETVHRNQELAEINARLQSAQQQLIQSEKLAAVGQLTAGIVHDVKNPLAVIKGLAEILQEEDGLNAFMREQLTLIRDNASRANTIVSDLLKFARQSTPEMGLRDMRETLQAALRLTEYLVRKGRVNARLEMPDEPALVMYDAQQVEQVLINLIQNAIQAMPNGGDLTLRLEQNAHHAIITVRDTGVGIAPENLRRIFDPFFTTKPEGEGTGLGLSVSYGIISRHNGEIEVDSVLGQGTRFIIHLPVNQPEALL
jgi:signal transduction histidine kinase